MRIEKDYLGKVRIPSNAYYGGFTARAVKHYTVTGRRVHSELIIAYAMIKRAAAQANKELKVIEPHKANAIVKACDELLAGKLHDQFPVDAINSGAGTAFNMNVNEVIANRALEITGRRKGDYNVINPNDHVNMSQSSNDTFPTAMHIAILLGAGNLFKGLDKLIHAAQVKGDEFNDAVKIGRTHLMDALPVTMGMEFAAYSYAIRKAKDRILDAAEDLKYIAIGATAVGTGVNAPGGYRKLTIKHLSKVSGLELKASADMRYALQSRFAVAQFSSALRNLALELIRIANDLRLMASGPNAGLGELILPAVHPGSSIMPGKINPSLAECLNMICFDIIGNDISVAMAVQAGQLELNVMLPGMLNSVLDSIKMLSGFLPVFASSMIDGVYVNSSGLKSYLEKNPVIVTLLNPYIGYEQSSDIYREAVKTNRSIEELVLSKGLISKAKLKSIFKRNRILGKEQVF